MENTPIWQKVERVVKDEVFARMRFAEERKNEFPEHPPVRKVAKSLYGFVVIEEEPVDFRPQLEKIDLEIGNYKKITQSQVDFAEKLHKSGIVSIAVLPASLWQGICKKFDLYRFENIDAEGKVNIATLSKSKLETASLFVGNFFTAAILSLFILPFGMPWYNFGILFVACLAFCMIFEDSEGKKSRRMHAFLYDLLTLALFSSSIFVTFGDSLQDFSTAAFAASLIGFGLLSIAVAFPVVLFVFVFGEKIIERFTKAIGTRVYNMYLRALSHKKLLKALWPDGLDTSKSENKIKVYFPDPPTEVFDVLKKLKSGGFQPMVAAVPDAVTLDIGEVKANWKEQIKNMNLDPIIYVKKGDNVAVLCQFGDFASEEEVVEWVKKEGLRICFN